MTDYKIPPGGLAAISAMEELKEILQASARAAAPIGGIETDDLRNAVFAVESGFPDCEETALMAAGAAVSTIERHHEIFDEGDLAEARKRKAIVLGYRNGVFVAKNDPVRLEDEECW